MKRGVCFCLADVHTGVVPQGCIVARLYCCRHLSMDLAKGDGLLL